jgi:hypothetical protein
MTGHARSYWVVLAAGLLSFVAGESLAADVYKASAKFTNAKGERVSTPVTITLEGRTADADRTALVEKAKANPEGAKSLLTGLKQLGTIEAVDRKVPIRYVYVQPGGDGEFITVISDEPLGFIGGDKSSKHKEGFDLTYAMLMLNASGKGRGEMAPASKIKFMESGAPAVADYGAQVVWLDDIEKVAQP